MIRIEYETQRLSLRFFVVMLVLFFVQTGLGLLLSAQHIDPTLLAGTLNFNVVRTQHLNLAIFWVLCGFIATILFVGPLLSRRELAAPWLIKAAPKSDFSSDSRSSGAHPPPPCPWSLRVTS